MFAKFPNLTETGRAGFVDGKAPDEGEPSKQDAGNPNAAGHDAAGHGVRPLEWYSLRARLSAEYDLRGSLQGENEALCRWMRAEGSFDPRAAEALGQASVGVAGGQVGVQAPGQADKTPGGSEIFEIADGRLPDPKTSQPIAVPGPCSSIDGGGLASGMSVED